jgi:hypothetical protein
MPETDDITHIILIGAMKCATTSLHQILEQNPAVATNRIKEINYFSRAKNSPEAYLAQFETTARTRYTLDSSTVYSKLVDRRTGRDKEGIPRRIARLERPVKLVYMMRDPVDRAESQFRHNLRRDRRSAHARQLRHLITTSLYARHIDIYRRHFAPEQLYLGSFDAFTRDPAAFMADLTAFLGTPDFDYALDRRVNIARREDASLSPEERLRIARKVLPDTRALLERHAFEPARPWYDRLSRQVAATGEAGAGQD